MTELSAVKYFAVMQLILASLRMMTSLINGNEVTRAEADMWMTSLAFIKNPTKDMLLELKVDNCL
jgi:hypothetical protein